MSTVANQNIAVDIFYKQQHRKALHNDLANAPKCYFEITAIRRELPVALTVLILQPLTKVISTDEGTIR